MALDLYAGPLSRYHSGDWKTIGQQMAEAEGIPFRTIRTNEIDDPLPQNVVTQDLHEWQQRLYRFMRNQGGVVPHEWNDTPDMDYLTDRPGWEGLAGLVFKSAYLFHPEFTAPKIVPDLETLDQDPAYKAASAEPGPMLILSSCEIWLPGDFDFAFEMPTLTGDRKMASSLGMLVSALDKVCMLWGKERLQVAQMLTDQPGKDATLDDAAIHGLCMFCRLSQFAVEHNVPLVLDY